MKVAIMLYGTRVSPRFGYSDGVLLVEVNNKKEIGRKTLEVQNCFPEQIPEILDNEGVEAVISGGMNQSVSLAGNRGDLGYYRRSR